MPIRFSQNENSDQSVLSDRQELIQAQLIDLFFKQSPLGISSALINSTGLVLLLWNQVDHILLAAWLVPIVLVALARCVLVRQYRRRDIPVQAAQKWGRWNMVGLGITGCMWAASIVVIFPSHSLVHQLGMALLVVGIVTGSASLYAGLSKAFRVFSIAPIVTLTVRFLTYGDTVHLVVASLSLFYLALMLTTARSFARIRRQLLSANLELKDRVAQRTMALEEANNSLKGEIQERREIEERLRQERDRLENITTTIGAGLAVISNKYSILWTNRIFRDTFGEVEGRPCYRIHHQQKGLCRECGARRVFEQGLEKAVHEQQHTDAEGNVLWFQIVTTPIRNTEGRVRAALELVLPITERKLAEFAKRRMFEQLEEARKTEAIATLAGGIAHQFNNALAVISGTTELMAHDYCHDSQIDRYCRPISDAANRMAQLTNQLLAYAKGGKYKDLPNDLSNVTDTTLSLIEHTIAPEISVNKLLEAGLPKVKMDVTQIQMVISAVVANAMEAINGIGEISVSCSGLEVTYDNCTLLGVPPGSYVALTIEDNGSGMDDRTVKRIFEPFFTTKFQGRGLGMAAVYGIIHNHGGHIEVSSQPGKGTRVCILLPALKEKETPQKELSVSDHDDRGTLLMVEDDPGVVDVNRTWLNRLGYEVIVAATAAQAIQIICRSDKIFDVVLLDLVLPDMSGAAVFPLIRQHLPSAKVVICSGYGLDGTTQELLDSGAAAFIQKPYTLANIQTIIRQVMGDGQ